jgi:hypothetical protein
MSVLTAPMAASAAYKLRAAFHAACNRQAVEVEPSRRCQRPLPIYRELSCGNIIRTRGDIRMRGDGTEGRLKAGTMERERGRPSGHPRAGHTRS